MSTRPPFRLIRRRLVGAARQVQRSGGRGPLAGLRLKVEPSVGVAASSRRSPPREVARRVSTSAPRAKRARSVMPGGFFANRNNSRLWARPTLWVDSHRPPVVNRATRHAFMGRTQHRARSHGAHARGRRCIPVIAGRTTSAESQVPGRGVTRRHDQRLLRPR